VGPATEKARQPEVLIR